MDKTDIVDAYSTARALLAEPSVGPVQMLEVYDPFVAKIEAVLEHRRMLVEVRTLVLGVVRTLAVTDPELYCGSFDPRRRIAAGGCAARLLQRVGGVAQ